MPLEFLTDEEAASYGRYNGPPSRADGDVVAAGRSLSGGHDLNGFPLLSHGSEATREMLDGVRDATFPVQVRHGSALASGIVRCMLASGLAATEGGPVSYCLPYSNVPLRRAIDLGPLV